MIERIFLDEVSDIMRIRQDRRSFMGKLILGGAGAAFSSLTSVGLSHAATADPGMSTVSFVTGKDRRDMVYQALKPLENDIKRGIRGKQIIIKPNLVGNEQLLCATHPDAIRGLLDFLKPIYKKQVIIGESTGRRYPDMAGTLKHYTIYNYYPLEKEYNVKLIDLNAGSYRVEWVASKEGHPLDIRICSPLMDPDNYIISICRLKTHNTLVVTLTAKNLLLGAPFVDGTRHDKSRLHSPGIRGMNFGVFLLAQKVQPSLAILDGLEGMEGNGPTAGTPVEHGVALASTDFIAADRMGCLLMDVNFSDCGYLTYCANAGIGQGDISKIKIIGPDPSNYIKKYKPHENIQKQLEWKD
ncbi:MAG: DUF362 domain-containing protein [Candidatus Latescibacterota bacterium]